MLFHALYILAIVVEAMTAALAAGRRAMDWVGVCMLGCVTALGGGSTRDLLLGHYPLSWVQHPYYLVVTAGAALFTIAIARVIHRLRNVCAVTRRRFPVGASPTRQPLQPEATGAVMEVTKWLKPSV